MDTSQLQTLRDGIPCPMRRLHVARELYRLGATGIRTRERLRYLRHRVELRAAIEAARIPSGMMIVEESGMDCDGVQYSGKAHEVAATLAAFDALVDRLNDSADGPFSVYPVRAGERVEYRSRDLTLEAFENGHPWTLRAGQ